MTYRYISLNSVRTLSSDFNGSFCWEVDLNPNDFLIFCNLEKIQAPETKREFERYVPFFTPLKRRANKNPVDVINLYWSPGNIQSASLLGCHIFRLVFMETKYRTFLFRVTCSLDSSFARKLDFSRIWIAVFAIDSSLFRSILSSIKIISMLMVKHSFYIAVVTVKFHECYCRSLLLRSCSKMHYLNLLSGGMLAGIFAIFCFCWMEGVTILNWSRLCYLLSV